MNVWKTIRRSSLFMTGGVLCSYIIAWGCVVLSEVKTQSGSIRTKGQMQLANHVQREHDWVPRVYSRVRGIGYEALQIGFEPAHPEPSKLVASCCITAGLPFKCVSGNVVDWCGTHWNVREGVMQIKAVPASQGFSATVLAPYKPMWLGLTLNSGVFSVVLFLPWWLGGLIKRYRRRQQQRCGFCGYIVMGSARCPECGR